MATRKRVGIIYQYNENWIGGTYYIENLISALGKLPRSKMPKLYIFSDNAERYKELNGKVRYPFLEYRPYIKKLTLFQRIINKLARTFKFHSPVFLNYYNDLAVVFPPLAEVVYKFWPGQKFLYWIPDFQEYFYPEFFSADEIVVRQKDQESIIENGKYILFSSNSVKSDFDQIYPESNLQSFVVQFAVTHQNLNRELQFPKNKIPEKYFICSNQFWKHKNHILVLQALKILKDKGENIFVVFTGKEHDHRHPDFFNSLVQEAKDLNIEDCIYFLGFVDRSYQLALMQKARAVIQPSLFEGWSTVIEDAKALGVSVIASNIKVHEEQLFSYPDKAFFPPLEAEALALCMLDKCNDRMNNGKRGYDYSKDVLNFAGSFNQVLELIC